MMRHHCYYVTAASLTVAFFIGVPQPASSLVVSPNLGSTKCTGGGGHGHGYVHHVHGSSRYSSFGSNVVAADTALNGLTNGEHGVGDDGEPTANIPAAATATSTASADDVSSALQALNDQVSALQDELAIRDVDGKLLQEMIDQRLQELYDDKTWELRKDVEQVQFKLQQLLEGGGETNTKRLIQDMTQDLRDDLEELERSYQDGSRELEVDLKKRITQVEDLIGNNDKMVEDMIAMEVDKLQEQFQDDMASSQERLDRQIQLLQEISQRQYENIHDELNRRDRRLDEELRQQSYRLASELSERDLRLYKLLEKRDLELLHRDERVNKKVGKLGFRIGLLYTGIAGRLAFLKFFLGGK
jgi:hypothetical protein